MLTQLVTTFCYRLKIQPKLQWLQTHSTRMVLLSLILVRAWAQDYKHVLWQMLQCFQAVSYSQTKGTKPIVKSNISSPRITLCLLSCRRKKAAQKTCDDIVPATTIFLKCYAFLRDLKESETQARNPVPVSKDQQFLCPELETDTVNGKHMLIFPNSFFYQKLRNYE